jgi:hypothetical protein
VASIGIHKLFDGKIADSMKKVSGENVVSCRAQFHCLLERRRKFALSQLGRTEINARKAKIFLVFSAQETHKLSQLTKSEWLHPQANCLP